MSADDAIDLAALLPDMTDSLGTDTPPACTSATLGFTLHKPIMGNQFTLVKIYNSLPVGSLDHECAKRISKAFLKELGFWKVHCSGKYFAHIMGHSLYIDSILPAPIYQEIVISKDYLAEFKNTNMLQFLLHITEGIKNLHEKGIAHGDLRGDTIFVANDGLPRISDPGLPRIISLLDKMNLKGQVEVIPAIRWMPPEYLKDEQSSFNPTKEGDIWQLGMTIFELWYGVLPYNGIPLWIVPSKIREAQLPKAPLKLSSDLEQYREVINFLCSQCWQRHPPARATATQLVDIMRELLNGKHLSTLRREYEANNQPSGNRAWGANFKPFQFSHGSSVASSDTSSFPDADSMSTESVIEGQSGSSTAASDPGSSQAGGATVKKEEVDDGSSVSGWSFLGETNEGSGNTNGSFKSTMFGQQSEGPNTKPFSAYPPPPSPENSWNLVGSSKTALMNLKAKNRIPSLHIEQTPVGDDHQPSMWLTVCTINGREYGRSTNTRKKSADEEAARQALVQISKEDPTFVADGSPAYLPIFKAYLEENNLMSRIEFVSEGYGLDHSPTWECEIKRDGISLANGMDSTKKKAEEKAAKKAAAVWNNPSVKKEHI